MQDNYSGLINFKVKIHHQRIKTNELGIVCSDCLLEVVNMVSRGVLERSAGCCNHGAA